MVAIYRTWAAIQTWPWPTILGFVTVSLIVSLQILKPWRRRSRLKRPFKARFVITARGRFSLSYIVQDDRDHFVKELVVPANSQIPIQIALEPKLSLSAT